MKKILPIIRLLIWEAKSKNYLHLKSRKYNHQIQAPRNRNFLVYDSILPKNIAGRP